MASFATSTMASFNYCLNTYKHPYTRHVLKSDQTDQRPESIRVFLYSFAGCILFAEIFVGT